MISTNKYEELELEGEEKLCFRKFLNGNSEKTVNLERILGIGGEGVVLSRKMDTQVNHYKNGLEEKIGTNVALKFVKFEKDANEDFLGPEREDINEFSGGINGNGKCVLSQYFNRLEKLGDFKAATHYKGGYSRPYIDFGISEIYQKCYHVIGQL